MAASFFKRNFDVEFENRCFLSRRKCLRNAAIKFFFPLVGVSLFVHIEILVSSRWSSIRRMQIIAGESEYFFHIAAEGKKSRKVFLPTLVAVSTLVAKLTNVLSLWCSCALLLSNLSLVHVVGGRSFSLCSMIYTHAPRRQMGSNFWAGNQNPKSLSVVQSCQGALESVSRMEIPAPSAEIYRITRCCHLLRRVINVRAWNIGLFSAPKANTLKKLRLTLNFLVSFGVRDYIVTDFEPPKSGIFEAPPKFYNVCTTYTSLKLHKCKPKLQRFDFRPSCRGCQQRFYLELVRTRKVVVLKGGGKNV